jgi:hypothetical protein
MKRITILIASILTMALLCSGCEGDAASVSYEGDTVSALMFYANYLEEMQVDAAKAMEKYCHYEDQEERTFALQSMAKDVFLSGEIVRIEKLSDKLWIVELIMETQNFPSPTGGANYVGILQGAFCVMTSEQQIPQELKEGITVEIVEPYGPDIVHPDEIVGVIPSA